MCVSQEMNPMTGLTCGHKGLIINKANFLSIADNGSVDTPTQLSTTRLSVFFPTHTDDTHIFTSCCLRQIGVLT